MNHALQLGPLLLPYSLLLVFASAAVALTLGRQLRSEAPAHVEQTLWYALLVGVVTARLAFVYEYRALYLAAPLGILDIRNGGWNPTFGLAGAWLFALYRERATPRLRKPLRWALAAGTAIYVVGTALLSFQPRSGQTLPALAFTSLDGTSMRLDQFDGQPTVINLWATWCPPCVREMPVLHEAQRQHPGVRFVFLNQGEDPRHVAAWLRAQGLSLSNVLLDQKRQASATFQQQGYPTTLFFNAQGELVSTRLGELSTATLAQQLQLVTRRP